MAIYLRWGTGKWGDLWGREPGKLLLAGGGRVSFSVSTHTSTNVRIQAGGTTQVVVRKSIGTPVVLRSGASLATTGTTGTYTDSITANMVLFGGARFTSNPSKHMAMDMPIAAGVTFRYTGSAREHLEGLSRLSGGTRFALTVSKATTTDVAIRHGPVLVTVGSALEHLYADMSLMGGGRLFGTVVKSAFAPFELLGQTVFTAPGRMLWVPGSFPTSDWKKGDPESTHWSRLQGERASWGRPEAAQGMWTVFYPNLSDWRDKK